jgi:histidinol-phosphate aminotransferase
MFRPEFQHLIEIERKRIVMPENVTLRLNRLERPESWQHGFLERLRVALPMDRLQQYPDYSTFYARLAAFNGVRPEEVVVGAGIEEFIRTLMLLSAAPGEKVAILYPTCAMFEIYAKAFSIELIKIIPDPVKGLTTADLAQQVPQDVKLVLLANPGQPVDCCFSATDLIALARFISAGGGVLAVDEAYHGFGAPTLVGMHDREPNMVALRTFSKAFGAASIRLGYAIGAPGVIAALNAVRQSGEVSALSMHIATALMDNYDAVVRPGIDAVVEGRNALRDRVEAELGLTARGSWANHVLIEIPGKCSEVAGRLAQRGVLVKANFPAPLADHMLVTCGAPQLMDEFFKELRAAL